MAAKLAKAKACHDPETAAFGLDHVANRSGTGKADGLDLGVFMPGVVDMLGLGVGSFEVFCFDPGDQMVFTRPTELNCVYGLVATDLAPGIQSFSVIDGVDHRSPHSISGPALVDGIIEAQFPLLERYPAMPCDNDVVEEHYVQILPGLDQSPRQGYITGLAEGSKEGWLWTAMIAAALRWMAGRKTSATRTWALLRLPL